jgi:hypothetical protein
MHAEASRWLVLVSRKRSAVDKRSAADEAAVRYLLGEMKEEEKTMLEQGFVGEEDSFEQVAAVEDELIDDYLSGALTAEERDRFEKVYLGFPERRERVEFAQALHRRLSEKSRTSPVAPFSPRVRRPFNALLAAAAVLFGAIGVYFAWTSIELRQELRRAEGESGSVSRRDQDLSRQLAEVQSRADRLQRDLERQQTEMARLSEQLANLQSQAARAVSFVLTGGLVRDGGTLQTLQIPTGTETVRLTLPISDSSYVSYRTSIQTPEGQTVWKGEAAPTVPGARSLLVTVPARALGSGDYILSVTGVTASGRSETAADFSFRVKKN